MFIPQVGECSAKTQSVCLWAVWALSVFYISYGAH